MFYSRTTTWRSTGSSSRRRPSSRNSGRRSSGPRKACWQKPRWLIIYIYIYMFHLKGVIVIVTVTVTVIVITIVKVILAIIVIIIMIIMIVVIVASPLAETYVCRFTLTGCAGMLVQVHRLHHSESTASFLVALSKWRSPCTRTNIPAQPVRVNLQT